MKAATRHAAGAGLALALFFAAAAGAAGPLPEGLPALALPEASLARDGRSGLALHGYDPVAYRLAGRAVPGRPENELSFGGAGWRFASPANRAAFLDAPDLYMPAFGGFDASAVAGGRTVDADPRRFAVIGGVLYLFRHEESRRRFLADAGLRRRAGAAWPAIAERQAQ